MNNSMALEFYLQWITMSAEDKAQIKAAPLHVLEELFNKLHFNILLLLNHKEIGIDQDVTRVYGIIQNATATSYTIKTTVEILAFLLYNEPYFAEKAEEILNRIPLVNSFESEVNSDSQT